MQHKILNFEKYLLIFTLVDILFAPYVFFLATSYSQFIIFFWFLLKDKRYFVKKEVNYYYGILFFVFLSVIVSLIVLPDNMVLEYSIENFKRGLSIGLAISYYFFFFYMFKVIKVNLEKWILAFVVFVSLWGVLYYLNTSLFLSLKVMFNPFDATLSNLVNPDFNYRYNYIWTDPNNVGYALVGVVSFLIIRRSTTNIALIISIICLLFSLLIIMSAGSIISAAVFIPTAIIIRMKNSKSVINFIMIALSLVVIGFIISRYANVFTRSEIGQESITRLDKKNETGDERPLIWKEVMENKNILFYLIAGEGVSMTIKGKLYSPHNGHLVFIFGFGMICYYLYMFLIFRKSRRQLWTDLVYILPFLLCFTVNIGIGELKYAAIMYMLVAFSRVPNTKELSLNQLKQLKKLKEMNMETALTPNQ